jgi:hypothetical protein
MEKRTDSWHHLQDQATPPPAEVFEKLRLLLDPASGETTAFRKLGDHSIPPPAHLRSIITMPRRSKKTFLLYAAAAACILFCTIGFLFYHPTQNHDTIVTRHKPHTVPSITATDTSSRALAAATSTTPAANTPDSAGTRAITLSPIALTIDGGQFALTDNSPLATFTSYRYPALGRHVNNPKKQTILHIHLDQYTNIALSPVMTATLRDLYDTRPDGTPSKKAKKTRDKLGKWDIEDKKEFDLHYTTNPLDPIDLAEFLFPPLFSFGRHSGAPLAPAGATLPAAVPAKHPDSPVAQPEAANSPLTVSYTLTLVTKKTNTGISETYNGGIQTLFDAGGHARLRLASLMRIQSIFLTPDVQTVTILTESAKPRNSVILTPGQWSRYNDKYTGATRDLQNDTAVVLGHSCKKALITLHDGRRISAWYTPGIQEPAQARLEPAFAGIPGLVLRYEYTCRRKTVRYTATSLSRQPIDPSVFLIPPASN